MTFLNWILLGGVAAAAIPVLIHLLHRSRYKVVRWGAMHLLKTSTTRRRRIRIEQWLLLAVRAAILAVLALCMARPVLTGMRGLLGGAAKRSVVVVMDNSLSMNAEEGGRTRWARACEEVGAWLGALPRGSEMFVVWMAAAEAETMGPSYDAARVQGELNAQRAVYGAADPAAALEAAGRLLERAHYAGREVLIASDFQKANWGSGRQAALARGMERLAGAALRPKITLLPLGGEAVKNVAVEAMRVSRAVVGVKQRVQVRATVRNHGEARAGELRVYFRVDGTERSAAQIALGGKESAQVAFNHAFESAGSHVFEVAVDADALKADNARRVSVTVWERFPVLLLSDDEGFDAAKGDMVFLEAALAPFAAAGENGGEDLIEVRRVPLSRPEAADLTGIRAVVIANARGIPSAWVKALDGFVREGGGVLVFPGDRTRPDEYRRVFQDRTNRFLPAMFGKLAGSNKGEAKPAAVAAQQYDHPALSLFNDPKNGSLSGAAIRQWYPLQTDRPGPQPPRRRGRNEAPEPTPAPEGKLAVLAKLDTGEALLIEKAYGHGRVVMCATAGDDKWSNLPSRPFYLPLVQELVVSLAARNEPPRTVEVGERLAAAVPAGSASAMLTDPEGGTHELAVQPGEAGGIAETGKALLAGEYQLKTLGAGLGGETIRFAVNAPAVESEPALLERGEVGALAKAAGGRVIERGMMGTPPKGGTPELFNELWKPLLALVLGLVFLEMLLEQRYARRTP